MNIFGRLSDNPRTEVDSRKDESLFQVCEKSYVPDAEGHMDIKTEGIILHPASTH